jgi:hypothetical protein
MDKRPVKDIRREYTPHVNKNECLALALSRISGKSYDDIYHEMVEKRVCGRCWSP